MRALAAVLALGIAPAALAADEQWTLGAGLDASTGSYGTGTETRIVSIPFTARYERDRWTYRLLLPYLEITGSSKVIPGLGPVDNSNRRGHGHAESTAAGFGDALVGATYAALAGVNSGIDLTALAKLATGDVNQGLGSGSNDLRLRADAWQKFSANTLFAGVGYTIFGDSPIVNLHNVWSTTVGFSHRLDDRDSAGLAFDYRQAGAPAPPAQRELMGFWSRKLERGWKLSAYVLKGFADGSPDVGAGIHALYSY